jgi:hypothetical protein
MLRRSMFPDRRSVVPIRSIHRRITRKSLSARADEGDIGFTRGLNLAGVWAASRISLEINEVRSWQ